MPYQGLAALNVRLGYLFDEKSLSKVQNRLQRDAQRLSAIGNQMSAAITLPILGIGAAAIKSAGDLESLQLALESQLGSAEAARKEIELLRKAALAPGLGFEQAVRGSVSLQAVGFSAEKARKIITEFGNGLAVAGKGAQELDGVVLALTQIQSKGVVSAEEINQIAERLPQIRTLMQAAFGTASSEAIQKLGISSQQFIEGITAQLEKLPRATGGIKNSVENFFDAVKQGAGKLGLAIAKAFDLPATLDSLAAGVNFLAEGFAALPGPVQTTAIAMAAVLAAAGPLVSVYGALKGATGQVVAIWEGMVKTGGSLINVVGAAGKAFLALNTAMKLTVIGAVLAAVTALYFAFQDLSSQMSVSERVAQSLEQVNRKAADSIIEEKLRAEQLIGVLKDQTATRAQQKAALNELQAISPQYFGRLDVEKAKVADLDKALGDYVNSLARAAKAQAAFEGLKDVEKNLNNLEAIAKPTIWQNIQNGAETAFDAFQKFGSIGGIIGGVVNDARDANNALNPLTAAQKRYAADFVQNKEDEKKALEAQREAFLQAIKDNTDLGAVTNGVTAATKNFTAAQKDSAKTAKDQRTELEKYLDKLHEQKRVQDQIREAAASMGLSPLDTLPQVGGRAQSQTPGAGPQLSTVATGLVQALTPAQALFNALNTGVLTFNDAFSLLAENIATNGSLIQQTMFGIADSATAFAESGASSIGGFVNALVAGAKKAVGAYIRIGVASVVAKALAGSGLNPFAALALGGIAGAAAQTLFSKLLSGIKVPEFAKGTKFAPGGLALVGERGPELVTLPRGSQVTPNNQLQQVLSREAGFVVSHRISGSDLLFVIERAQAQSKRVRGF